MENRRNFLKKLTTLTIAGGVVPHYSFAQNNVPTTEISYNNEAVYNIDLESSFSHTIVGDEKENAIVVLANNPTTIAKYAADELVKHIEAATGFTLNILPESEAPLEGPTFIYIGNNDLLSIYGMNADEMPQEAFRMRSVGKDIFIFGKEDNGEPLDMYNVNSGTLFGVYEFLERFFKVRWLWPGKLGTFVPKTREVIVPPLNYLVSPPLRFREIAWGRTANLLKGAKLNKIDIETGFSPNVAKQYAKDLNIFLRRQRMGGMSNKPPSGHYFRHWWKLYGAEHPEWFALRKDGMRGSPNPNATDIPLCITNEELQDFIIQKWDGKGWLELGPNDVPGRCNCEKCQAWDSPQPKIIPWFAQHIYGTDPDSERANIFFSGVTSNRYAHFWKVMQKKAQKINPNALITASFLYENELPSPTPNVKLNKNIYGEFVQWRDPHLRWFPMHPEAFQWIKKQWVGWSRTGLRMAYRPNYLHDGYVMPLFETKQSAEFIKFTYKNGMEGARFDSLTGQWAVQGLRLYLHFRLMGNPNLAINEIQDEYFSAFGPASIEIREYMEYWEDYAFDNAQRFIKLFNKEWRYLTFPNRVHIAFPPKVFVSAKKILEKALKKTINEPNPEFSERVKFLEIGLEHAILTTNFAAIMNGERQVPEYKFDEAKRALKKLIDFRKENQDQYFSDLHWVTNFWESLTWDLDDLIKEI